MIDLHGRKSCTRYHNIYNLYFHFLFLLSAYHHHNIILFICIYIITVIASVRYHAKVAYRRSISILLYSTWYVYYSIV